METLVFFRKDGDEEVFYPVGIPDIPGKTIEEIASDSAEINPGTVRVEDVNGRVLWRLQ